MARIARVVVPGLPHHLTQRGYRGQQTFFGDEDFAEYRRLMALSCWDCGTRVWAYCLTPNQVQLIMVPSSADGLRCAVAEAHRRYTRMINLRQGWRGRLWQERFHSVVLDEPHLLAAARYVERYPARAGLCASPEDWPWSSAQPHLRAAKDQLVEVPALLKLVPDWHSHLAAPDADGFSEQLELHSRTGRPLGADEFVQGIETRLGRYLRPRKPGPRPK